MRILWKPFDNYKDILVSTITSIKHRRKKMINYYSICTTDYSLIHKKRLQVKSFMQGSSEVSSAVSVFSLGFVVQSFCDITSSAIFSWFERGFRLQPWSCVFLIMWSKDNRICTLVHFHCG